MSFRTAYPCLAAIAARAFRIASSSARGCENVMTRLSGMALIPTMRTTLKRSSSLAEGRLRHGAIDVDMAGLPGYVSGSPEGSDSGVDVINTCQHTQMSNGGEVRLLLRIDVQLAYVAAQIGHKCPTPPCIQRHANSLFKAAGKHVSIS